MTRWTRRGGAAALLVAGLLLAACTSDEPDGLTLPSPSETPTSPSPTPTPTPEPSPTDPFAVPDEIDAAYVERVLNEINRIDADLTRDILRRPVDEDALELPAQDLEVLESIYAEPILTFNTNALVALLRSPDERDDLVPADEYGQLRMDVEAILETSPCIVARVDRDYSQTDAERSGTRSTLGFVFLSRAAGANEADWRLARLLGSDAEPNSEEEQELRELRANDLDAPEDCR